MIKSDTNVFCDVDEETFGKPLDNLGIEAGCQGTNYMIGSLELSVPPP